ncbi:membrane-associated tyrosine- and threonine-specific cdc2-inhibitory kinase isoform X2 [Alligator mississippiensis]|uniref:membrane-associated tyrosine- and threonine-specific cdc2-inhibitory kinase isoform X2 n=1 Tax=Alligator mississippiensis TaxID=8496 RepID=UPI000906FE5D|nr:membrane-associated tyrosine- and threonine-specific cdc2-inhibitory kinase isoform X2 [Alligator mississippiensis]
MPVPPDEAGPEPRLSRTPLPVPAFFREAEGSFSAKRPQRASGYSLPSRPRHKVPPTVSRVFPGCQPQPWSQPRARLVWCRGAPGQAAPPADLLYDPAKRESFLRQCFQVLGHLGRGSFGEVYKVRSRADGRLYAVKRSVEPFRGAADRHRKLAEARRHGRVGRHPNCLGLARAWEERGQLYLQTELCPGSLLQHCEARGQPPPERRVRAWLWDLLRALQHVRVCGLVHLDVKPANVFLTARGVCKLGDFGLALELGQAEPGEAQEGDPRYMAPELLCGDYSPAADVFSLGMTILEVACNLELPTGGEAWQQLRQGYLPPEFTAGLSLELQALLAAMLEPDPRLRPSAETLLESDLMRCTGRWRRLALLAEAGLEWGAVLLQGLMSLLWGVCLALCSLAHWRQGPPTTPPRSPLLPAYGSFSSDWEEDEDDEGGTGSLALEVFQLSGSSRDSSLQDRAPSAPRLSLPLSLGSTSTPRQTPGGRKQRCLRQCFPVGTGWKKWLPGATWRQSVA